MIHPLIILWRSHSSAEPLGEVRTLCYAWIHQTRANCGGKKINRRKKKKSRACSICREEVAAIYFNFTIGFAGFFILWYMPRGSMHCIGLSEFKIDLLSFLPLIHRLSGNLISLKNDAKIHPPIPGVTYIAFFVAEQVFKNVRIKF